MKPHNYGLSFFSVVFSIHIINTLKEINQTITFAESCTGGRIASAFTAISGASAVLNGSVVSYANEIKSQWLDVKRETLIKHGAVSEACVAEMLSVIIRMASVDYGIAVSGIAEKPVGTVYIGIETPTIKTIERHHLKGDIESVQEQAKKTAISLLKNNL